jgi:hypothetical protein
VTRQPPHARRIAAAGKEGGGSEKETAAAGKEGWGHEKETAAADDHREGGKPPPAVRLVRAFHAAADDQREGGRGLCGPALNHLSLSLALALYSLFRFVY